ncbi:DinB family protein [Hymenobacter negativus]|uniref:DinB family protein n=1 Tax=Hymenobacter negativus TaxID=2795026 RepID=A0ABS3QHT0_9BACT|nr:DinB family protein [Hymenobacter negativus]MBO2010344.1 DinB family protein [Hymenobacter negativus]
MLVAILQTLFERDLNKLKLEIESYRSEDTIWRVEKSISNSAGNLCLHLIGNLNTYIGAELGGSGYVRHRELEFSRKDVPRAELVAGIEATRLVVGAALAQLPDEQLSQEYPVQVFESETSTAHMLLHLATHLTYHLGQINYHRRLLDA